LGKKELQIVKDFSLKVGEASLSLGRIANDIQEGVMKLRMLPIGQLFNRMPRLIRDLSRRVGKVVALEVRGGDTEVDKRVIEQIYNPLVHLIRNAVDHGIEDKDTRRKLGKKEEGMISLSAYSQGNQVVIDVEDDGAGINSKAVLERAVESRLIDAQDAKGLTAPDIQNFLFIPGFSTSKRVTRTSGRGVGMDVVKKDVEKINGHVEIESEESTGTRISIRIPLTLAIIQTLLIRTQKHVFAIPLTSVREILQVASSEITTIEGFEVIKFRDETIPILRIDQVFRLKDYDKSKAPRFLVLAMAGLKTVGLMVEELIGEQDVVIKPLAEHVCESRGLAGSTILGDGTIALVLDVTEMVEDIINQQRQLAASGARQFQTGRLPALNNHVDL
jgi:two-component system chemotaxis sensor kinase CheA